jgi:hypothetical protein
MQIAITRDKAYLESEIRETQNRIRETKDEGLKRGMRIYLNELYKELRNGNHVV